jgi:thousand and one amino acid protein kinase
MVAVYEVQADIFFVQLEERCKIEMENHKQLLDKEYESLLQQFSKELEKLQIRHQQELEKKVCPL